MQQYCVAYKFAPSYLGSDKFIKEFSINNSFQLVTFLAESVIIDTYKKVY